MRRLASGLAVVATALALGCGRGEPGPLARELAPGRAAGANLLLVTLDTTRADHLGCYGAVTASTPTIDALAAGGIRFTNAVSAAPVTLPAHATILHGANPPRHGLRWNGDRSAAPGLVSIAERFRDAGYDTAAFVSAFVLDRRYGLDRGFAVYDDRVSSPGETFPSGNVERTADRTVDAALAWLATRASDRPWFVWLHLYDPHAPYDPPAPFATRFAAHPYAGEIASADAELGRLVAEIDSRRSARPTAIALTADHGEGLGEHDETTHSIFLYDATMRVPLLLRPPDARSDGSGVVESAVGTVDLAPTLLSWFALPPLDESDGLDLTRIAPAADRALYLETRQAEREHGWSPLFALRRTRDKLILAPRAEYYDLAADPGERSNLWVEGSPAAAEPLARSLAALRRTDPGESVEEATRDPEAEAKLSALGYLSPRRGAAPTLADPKDRIREHAAILAANAAVAAGRLDEAAGILDRAREDGVEDRALRLVRARLEVRRGRLPEAERALRAITAENPTAETDLLLAQILVLDRKLEEAAALLDRARAAEPDHGGIWIAMGDLRIQQGRPRDALPLYRRALELDPYRARGPAEARISRLEAALAAAESKKRTNPAR